MSSILRTLHCFSFASPFLSSKPNSSLRASMATSVRIAVVGDVHDDWNLQEDTKALQFLRPDLVLFTGDFGNENVELVQSVASTEFPKAVILGNHDSWFTQQLSGKLVMLLQRFLTKHKKFRNLLKWKKNRVEVQLECLGEEHVAYQRLDFPPIKLSVVGGRPFSCGGERLFRKRILSARYGVEDMDGSAKRIYKAALDTPEGHSVIFLAHNGPTGLGSNVDDICGKDWVFDGGDHGDPDLAKALSLLKDSGKVFIPVVVFGHMHKELASGRGLRKMIVVGDDNTIYLNGAVVPRVKRLIDEHGTADRSSMSNETPLSASESSGTIRAFTTVDISNGRVDKIAETWVSVVGDKTALKEEHVLFRSCN